VEASRARRLAHFFLHGGSSCSQLFGLKS